MVVDFSNTSETGSPFKGLFIFIYGYFLRLGFLDGMQGLYYALALSIYYSMIAMKCKELTLKNGVTAID